MTISRQSWEDGKASVSKDGRNTWTRGHPSRRAQQRAPQDELGDIFTDSQDEESKRCWSACRASSPASPQSRAPPRYFNVIASPLRSTLAISPTCWPDSSSTAPFWLVSTIARAPPPTASAAPPAP